MVYLAEGMREAAKGLKAAVPPDAERAGALRTSRARRRNGRDSRRSRNGRSRSARSSALPDRALGVLHSMVREGAIDGEVLALYEASRAWETI